VFYFYLFFFQWWVCAIQDVPGRDAAGVAVEVGDGVSKFKNGDEDEVYSDI
jgi:NADPH:quinone reductase-like Zn-dependent oxidoreductase